MSKTKKRASKNTSFSLFNRQINSFYLSLNLKFSRFTLLLLVLFTSVIFGGYFHATFSKNHSDLVNHTIQEQKDNSKQIQSTSKAKCNRLVYNQNEFDVTFSETEDDDETSKNVIVLTNHITSQILKFPVEIVKHVITESSSYTLSNLYLLFLVFRI